jgi:hypothetical protein
MPPIACARVIELQRLVLLEQRDGVGAAALVNGDLVVAQPRVHARGIVGVAVPADLPQLGHRDSLAA